MGGSRLLRFLAKIKLALIIVFCRYIDIIPGPQNLPKLDFLRLFFMPRTILNLHKIDFHENVSLGEQLLQLTFFDTSTNF